MSHPVAANEPIFNERGLQDARIPPESDIQRGMMQAPGQSFADWLEGRVARFSTRRYDWDALKFQADYDPKYRRAQMRYVGTGATGVASDENTVLAEHFTFSTMILPAGAEGPLHIHTDVEEVFFVLRGRVKLIAEPWDIGPGGYQVGNFPRGWHEWNDHFRDAMRAFWLRPDIPANHRATFARRLCASSDLFQQRRRSPLESVNYVVSHDGFTLRDLVSYGERHNLANGEGNRDGHHFLKEIALAAETFPLGTKITVAEPVQQSAPSGEEG